MRVEKWEERSRYSHRERGAWGPDYQREIDRQTDSLMDFSLQRSRGQRRMKGRKEEEKRKEGERGETEKEMYRGKERERESKVGRGASPGELATSPAPTLLLAWQPAGPAGEWAPGGCGAQAGEPNVSVMCLSPNQFISYKQHDIRS